MKVSVESTNSICVCGGGHQGLSMAAHIGLNGVDVTLWNRTSDHIQDIINTGVIECSGILKGIARMKRVSSEIGDVISDYVMITTPSSAVPDIARLLAPYVHRDMVIVLNPGRTFGAIEFAKTLKLYGVTEFPHIAETQTIVYTCRRGERNNAVIYALKDDVGIASVKSGDIKYILDRMPICLRTHFKPVESTVITSFSNVGMILHCSPVLMNVGWIESSKTAFKYYYDGISDSIACFLEKMDAERVYVASAMGVEVETVTEWLKRTYHVTGGCLYECLRNNLSYREIDAPHTIYHRYLLEDVPCGLVPVEDVANKRGIKVPAISTIISLASLVTDIDFRKEGRRYEPEYLE
jgi:opine dehydrogenase